MPLDELISEFIEKARKEDDNLFPFMANKKTSFNEDKDSVYYSGPFWDDDEIQAIFHSILKGKWLSAGESVNSFEKRFSKKFDSGNSVMVNSGSSANLVLIAALKKHFNWKDGDEIIVSCVGFPTTINPIIQNNLKPIFVDINWDDLNWDLDQVEKCISSKTRAVFSSPVLGNPYDINRIIELCANNKIELIADNCDSLGSKWKNKYLTDYAVASSCSFYPAHHITTIEGGMVSSQTEEIIDLARSFAWWGRGCYCVGKQNLLANGACGKRFSKWIENYDHIVDHKYLFTNIGYNLKPTNLQGAIGVEQLKKYDQIHLLRNVNKNKLDNIFERIDGLRTIKELPDAETSWFGVPLICKDKKQKTELVKYLEKNRIQTRNYFAGNILMHPAYSDIDDFKKFPNANLVLDRVFFIGCSPTITNEMITYVEVIVDKFISYTKTLNY
jgi:CDP-4-dehydro-6-deoxyglucose reductase, E1